MKITGSQMTANPSRSWNENPSPPSGASTRRTLKLIASPSPRANAAPPPMRRQGSGSSDALVPRNSEKRVRACRQPSRPVSRTITS